MARGRRGGEGAREGESRDPEFLAVKAQKSANLHYSTNCLYNFEKGVHYQTSAPHLWEMEIIFWHNLALTPIPRKDGYRLPMLAICTNSEYMYCPEGLNV